MLARQERANTMDSTLPMQSFAIVPAAGRSVRMGKPKLLLPWGDSTLMEHVLTAWRTSRVGHVVVVVRPDDDALHALCCRAGAEVVTPDVAPREMRVSVQLGLEHVEQQYAPNPSDVWLLAPADMPGLSARLINRLLDTHDAKSPTVLVPTFGGKRGHPVLFPWALAERVKRLAENEGVNTLLERHTPRHIDCDDRAVLHDLDTPQDYLRLRRRE
jgi:molybdenum cofactor cytidylyltransferase